MPLAIWIIGFAIFAQGSSELMLAGLLPEISADLGATIPQAGELISAFALGMLIGAPVLAVLTLRWPRRHALLLFLSAFILSHLISAITNSYVLLLTMRFAGAFAYAGFWTVGSSTAMQMAGPHRRGRAMSIVAGGLTVATVLGLPASTWIGQHLGWRAAFWAVTILCTLAAGAIMIAVPPLRPERRPRIRNEINGLATPRLWLSYAMTSSSTAALVGTFSYLAAMLVEATGLARDWVPLVLFGYGLGALIGITIGGRAADRTPRLILGIGFTGLLLTSLALVLAARSTGIAVVLIFILGLLGFSTNPVLSTRFMAIATNAPVLAVAGNISAFNVGIALGPWLGGLALAEGYGYRSIPAVGAAIAGIALLLWGWDILVSPHRRHAR